MTDERSSSLVLIGGCAGVGKSTVASLLSAASGWPVLDKDTITRPFVERLLLALGGDPHDRHTPIYVDQVRPLEYQVVLDTALEFLDAGISTIIVAPFLREFTDPEWLNKIDHECQQRGANPRLVWVAADPESMRSYLRHRNAPRDSWKLENWDHYLSTMDLAFRPATRYHLIDNRRETPIPLADQIQHLLTTSDAKTHRVSME